MLATSRSTLLGVGGIWWWRACDSLSDSNSRDIGIESSKYKNLPERRQRATRNYELAYEVTFNPFPLLYASDAYRV